MSISVVIPTYNEEKRISQLLQHLLTNSKESLEEIIVMDAKSSTDGTLKSIQSIDKVIPIKSQFTSRAQQMNEGARLAKGTILYFVHADAIPPASYVEDIELALQTEADFGIFCYQFDSSNPLLRINAYSTRFNGLFAGGGDQTLFIKKELFFAQNGFREDLPIMEDFDFFWRLRKNKLPFEIVQNSVTVSARKYDCNSYLKVNLVNFVTFFLFKLGYCPFKLKRFYGRVLKRNP